MKANAEVPVGWERVRIGDAIAPISSPIQMRDSDDYRLVSLRRRHGGMFDRERLFGKEILTKSLEEVMPGAFILARMQVVHGACGLVPDSFKGAAVSKSYVQFLPREGFDIRFFDSLSKTPAMHKAFMDASQGVV